MFFNDIRVPAEEAEIAFMRAWDLLVGNGLRYAASFNELAREGKDELVRYRAKEMVRLLGERGRLKEFD